jgi:hypothetical protein
VTISKSAITSNVRNAEKQLRATIQKAFGMDHEIHIKESGPSWVNSPRGDLGDAVINPIISRQVNVVVNAPTVKAVKRPASVKVQSAAKAGAKKSSKRR